MAELNGAPADLASVTTLALSNFGHFTTMRVDGGRVRGLSLHLDRLVRDCQAAFDAALDPDRVRHHVRHALSGAPRPVMVRVTVFDPALDIGHLAADARPQVLVTTRPAVASPLPPLRVRTARHRREIPAIKHTGLFGLLAHRRAAQRAGFDDVLFVDATGTVGEGATWNIGFLEGDRLICPAADVLPGITMNLVGQVCGGASPVTPVTVDRLAGLDAAFAMNAAVGIRPITSIDGTHWTCVHPDVSRLVKEYEGIPAERL
jgi:branched-subunit amino acid aminotransferase/4-amino-4-deoxychorismate lyase